MLGFLSALDWRFETVLILSCSLLTVVAALWCLYRDGRADGDYVAFLEDDFDQSWFDVVIEGIGEYPVLSPPDIGGRKRDRLSGRIKEVGMGLHHNYQGVAVVKASSGFYLYPLSSIVPNSSMKCGDPAGRFANPPEPYSRYSFRWIVLSVFKDTHNPP